MTVYAFLRSFTAATDARFEKFSSARTLGAMPAAPIASESVNAEIRALFIFFFILHSPQRLFL